MLDHLLNSSEKALFMKYFVILFLLFFLMGCQTNVNYSSEKTYREFDFSCSKDSDCILKNNNLNCVIAVNHKEEAGYKRDFPPSHTVCPDAERVVPYCNITQCEIKYDCSQCEKLREEMSYCNDGSSRGPMSDWICRMYAECNC